MRLKMKQPSDEKEDESEKLNPNGYKSHQTTNGPNHKFNIVRRVYEQNTLNKDADYHLPHRPIKYHCKKLIRTLGYGGDCLINSVPIVRWLPKYKPKEYLFGDLVAGATTAVMHIPQGMAYALLAEVPPIVGLYMAFFPVLVYVIFGTSPHISMGTFAVACLMAGKVVLHWSHPHLEPLNGTLADAADTANVALTETQYTPLQVLSVLCLAVGLLQLSMWIFRLGAVSTLLSEPLVSGFTTAAAFTVLSSQLKDLFGVKLPKLSGNYKAILTVVEVCKRVNKFNWAAVAISFTTCLIISLSNELLKPWVSKRSKIPVPIELLAVVIGTLTSRYCHLAANYNITLVGTIPTGLPAPVVPPLELLPNVLLDAFTITMVTYSISMSMALIFANKEKYEIHANQELLAMGAGNVFGSFFCCAPFCASLSRSYIQYQTGAKTNLTSVVSATLILFVLLWIGPFFEELPRSVLAGIIVVSLKGMYMQFAHLPKFWKLSQLDAIVWIVTFLVTLTINIDIGLAAGLLASVATLFCRSQMPYTCLLGRVLNTDIYLDIKRYRAAEEITGIKIFHYCGGLNFATKNLFRDTLFRKVGVLAPAHQSHNDLSSDTYEWDPTVGHRVQCVIIDATALSYVDVPGIKVLVAIQKELVANDIRVLFAGANAPVLEMITKYNTFEKDQLQLETFPTVHDAVVYFKLVSAHREKDPSLTITGSMINNLDIERK